MVMLMVMLMVMCADVEVDVDVVSLCLFSIIRCSVLGHSFLDSWSEVTDQPLYRPSCGVTESTDGVTFDLLTQLPQHVNFSRLCISFDESVHDLRHPRAPLTTRRTLTTCLVLVEVNEPTDAFDHVLLLVHHNHGSSSETGLVFNEGVEIHENVVADVLGQHGDGGSTRDDTVQVVPTTLDTTAVFVDEFSQWDRHFFFNNAGLVHVTRDTEEFGSSVSLTTESAKPIFTTLTTNVLTSKTKICEA